MFTKVDPKENLIEEEKRILKFWKENKTFERSIQNRANAPIYSFIDGPPFATGVPHYGTILSSVAKDVVPRYWTMKGFRVDRRWGWDCHGLPTENLVEKKLGIKAKIEIEQKIGIQKFNEECRKTVLEISSEWEDVIDRIGRWVDFKNAYRTMDNSYMESVWWAMKELHGKGLLYEDTRISLYCPRCETPLSNFEIAMDNSYEDTKDTSVTVKFKIDQGKYKENSLLVWTTTPWTLPANTGLAVGKDIIYVRVKSEKRETLIIAKDRVEELTGEYAVLEEITGQNLTGITYIPPFSNISYKNGKEENLHKIWEADFVSTQEGTGIVHIAPAYGEDDFELARKNDLPRIEILNTQAIFTDGPWKGESIWDAYYKIIGDLKEKKILYKKQNITHSYPYCHRCHTKLIYKTQPAWFINIQKIKDKLIAKNEEINWYPPNIKHGRFLKGLESAPDWNITRDRYWGTPVPIWRCNSCKKVKVVGSFEELYQLSGQKIEDYHRPYVDEIDFKCECPGMYKRIPQVLDGWVDSGSVPYGERHYPFENQEDFTKKFPADFISEYIAQTRAWFYVLHVLSVSLFGEPAFKNVVNTGVIAGEDGRKMSKSLSNYTDPKLVLDEYGADALRFYLMGSSVMNAQNIAFSTKDIAEVKRGVISTLWNSYSFFITYALVDNYNPNRNKSPLEEASKNILDRWILAELNRLILDFERKMDNYRIAEAAKLITDFVDNLSNWYIRRSRRRFWKSKNDEDKNNAYDTLYTVLTNLSQVIAPLMPYISESIYKNLTRQESVHLSDCPAANKSALDDVLIQKMQKTRDVVKTVLALRAKAGIKVRQPLEKIILSQSELAEDKEISQIIKEEINVKKISFKEKFKETLEIRVAEQIGIQENFSVGLDTKITPQLKLEGEAREIIRHIQEMRRKANYEVNDRIVIFFKGGRDIFKEFKKIIARETLAKRITEEKPRTAKPDIIKKIEIDDKNMEIAVKKLP